MSIPVKQTVSCPKCGKDIEFTMWQSINNEMSFAIKDIISGKLFEVECKNCGLRTHVNYPILVNDMEHDVMIWYTYPDGIEETEKALVSMKKMYNGHLRIVTDQADLREKVAIFSADLDDRIIEVLTTIITPLLSLIVSINARSQFWSCFAHARLCLSNRPQSWP